MRAISCSTFEPSTFAEYTSGPLYSDADSEADGLPLKNFQFGPLATARLAICTTDNPTFVSATSPLSFITTSNCSGVPVPAAASTKPPHNFELPLFRVTKPAVAFSAVDSAMFLDTLPTSTSTRVPFLGALPASLESITRMRSWQEGDAGLVTSMWNR